MKEFNPLVSIIIPVYNGSDFLAEAIDSALMQTYKNIEILVVNDGSTDGGKTRNIAHGYGEKIIYFEKENGGVATALNFGIDKMQGDYFSWLSHDDKYYPHKIEHQIAQLTTLEDKNSVLYSNYDFINEKGSVLSTVTLPHINPEGFYGWILYESALHGCSLLIPKECFVKCGNFDMNLWTTQDYDLWFRIAEKFHFIHNEEVLISSRTHENQTSRTMPRRSIIECNQLYAKVLKKLEPKLFNDVAYMTKLADAYYERGFYLSCIAAIGMVKNKNRHLRKRRTLSMIHILKKQRFLLKYLKR
jgi:glycosyltransferase involved in cell wall biosynthesis